MELGSISDMQTDAENAVLERSTSARIRQVVNSPIGVLFLHVDQQSGDQMELVVNAEYFSANGRTCRRYVESNVANGESRQGLICNDHKRGWLEVPLGSFAG